MKAKSRIWWCSLCGHARTGRVCHDCRLTREDSAKLDDAKAKGAA
jgi:recombinational DNA repair protein RecR